MVSHPHCLTGVRPVRSAHPRGCRGVASHPMSDWRELAAELAEDGDRIGLLASAVTERIVAGLPLAADEQIAEATRRSVADNIWLFASMAAAEIPPERAEPRTLAEEFVRLLARRGIGADTVAASY